MIRPALILLSLAAPAAGETARVYSGEHGDFTRLVIELPNGSDWLLGRTEDGYAFATKDAAQPDYDLAGVWRRISRARASAILKDPGTGALRLSLGCDCHITPFEFRPGVVVLDIRPGAAPKGSEFEVAFDGQRKGAAESDQPQPAGGPVQDYTWLDTRATTTVPNHTPSPLPLPLATGGVSLEPLRNELLEQLARGAAEGIVDLGLPAKASGKTQAASEDLPWSGIRIGEQPGLATRLPNPFENERESDPACTPEPLLDIAAWGEALSPLDILASARSGLHGEFDIADPDAVLRSVRLHLHLGFGAEAIQMTELVSDAAEAEPLSIYKSMGRIIDGEPDPATPFAGMLDCDGPAALWAALARDRLPRGPGVNRAAILRAFQSLPSHLRSHLGSGLADRFLAIDDADAARMIRDAMSRAPQVEAKTIALLDASNSLHRGDIEAARRHAAEAVALDGNQATSLVTLVEAHFQDQKPLAAEIPETLRALRGEIGASELGAKVDRAIVLSLALSGQMDAAFSSGEAVGKVLADLWNVAASRADDDSFLRHAVLPTGNQPPALPQDLALNIAVRLLDLGFPDAALAWIGPVSTRDTASRRLAAARAQLGRGDARAALQLLEGLNGAESESVRAAALFQLDDLPQAASALRAARRPDDAIRVELWQGKDPATESDVSSVWKDPALSPSASAPAGETGLLGRAATSVDASMAARAAVETLLRSVPQPSGN
ncbi:hypothetical protein [Rhodobacter calidifons]|uniref:HEAT repeat protein n=1 Tax=Rhodobacter calidifons TaxID=2715277 RepID=A0ABX0G607_9RHOB|nr:hypothetical protein [Rhodobacter calidifons]NHB76646.1 hypothetical protein [Rhodobacter calidifons]